MGRATRGRGQEREPVDVKTLFFHLPICLKSGDTTRRTSSRVLWRLRWRTNTLRNSEKCDMRVQSLMSADTTRCHSHCRRSLSHRRRWAFVAVVTCTRVDARARIKKSYWRRAERFRARVRSRRRTHAPRARPATVSSPAPPGAPPRPLARRTRARVRSRSLASRPGGSLAGHARGSVRSRPLVSRAPAGVAPRGERESGRDPPSDVMSITLEHRCVLTPRPTRRARAPRSRRASRGPATATTVRSRRRRARHLSFPPLGGGPTSTASGAHARPS